MFPSIRASGDARRAHDAAPWGGIGCQTPTMLGRVPFRAPAPPGFNTRAVGFPHRAQAPSGPLTASPCRKLAGSPGEAREWAARPGKEIPLKEVAPERGEKVPLLRRLDALGHDHHSKLFA